MRPRKSLNPPLIHDDVYDRAPDEPRRDRQFSIRMNSTELESVRYLASSKGVSMSEWLRWIVGIHLDARERVRVLRQQSEEYASRLEAFAEKYGHDGNEESDEASD